MNQSNSGTGAIIYSFGPIAGAVAYALFVGQTVGTERLAAIVSLDRLYPDSSSLVGIVDNHDLPRIASLCGNDEGQVAQALAALAFLRAVPAIQYGTEAALSGMAEPFG